MAACSPMVETTVAGGDGGSLANGLSACGVCFPCRTKTEKAVGTITKVPPVTPIDTNWRKFRERYTTNKKLSKVLDISSNVERASLPASHRLNLTRIGNEVAAVCQDYDASTSRTLR